MSTPIIDKGYGFDAVWTVYRTGRTVEDLAGATVTWKLARTRDATEPLLTKTTGDGVTISTVASTAALSLTSAETEALAAGSYYHQLSVALSGGQPKIYFAGNLNVVERL